jgi:hypothetical protein
MALAKNLSFYMNGVSLGCALQSFDATAETEALDATTLCQSARSYALGLTTGTVSASGIWDYDSTNSDKIHEAFNLAYTQGSHNVVTATLTSLAVGAEALLFNATETNYNLENAVGQLIIVSADFQTTSGLNFGKIIFSAAVDNTTTNGTTIDGGAASTNGALFQVQVINPTEDGGSVKLQHSTDGSTWVDVVTLNLTGSGKAYEGLFFEVPRSTNLNRYTRAVCTADDEEITFICALSRR